MKKYHLTILRYYTSHDTTRQTTIVCDGMSYSQAGCYEFWIKENDTHVAIAYYPIKQTIITNIEQLEDEY